MRYISATEIVMTIAILALFIIFELTYRISFSPVGSQRNALTGDIHSECRIWPDLSTVDPSLPIYASCPGDISSPYVGDSYVLGNPQRCLAATSRLDQYHEQAGRNWSEVKWGEVQSRCASINPKLHPPEKSIHQRWQGSEHLRSRDNIREKNDERSAIVLRTWDDYEYTDTRLAWLRALIAEVSLQRHDGYQVFFLVNIKDPELNLEDNSVYDTALQKFVPEEFRDMALLFNEGTLNAWYPLIQEHGAQDQMYQALQIFSSKFSEYSYVWQLEMDLRFTGHVHDTLAASSAYAKAQGRRNLWERNGRFYIPELHGSHENFLDAVDLEIGDTGVWGPAASSEFIPAGSPPPPRTEQDWGVGEEADLITFMPMIDPVGTDWIYETEVHGFKDGVQTPRRAAIISITRSSRRLLQLVDEAQRQRGQWLVSEATLETFSLLHGLKAVTVPHPIAFAGNLTPEELDSAIHKGPPSNKAGGKLPSMLYTKEGWVPGPWREASYWFTGNGAQAVWDSYVGGAQLPPMLLHPVKEK
ncbi:hypothetical protein O1611_g1665 [Lasiodiplodia mahajangana]|uniref:Uncharacterized protein n=1 Tax=Lasiodiplodia mahajangana TaxID=1108764 RepID=A0ACC2JWT2_9PEZI|nr:hypothetical protein O1611_g1665 [Lasiodiplodia mahajangana]